MGTLLPQGPCFCIKILPWGRAFDYTKEIPWGFAGGDVGTWNYKIMLA